MLHDRSWLKLPTANACVFLIICIYNMSQNFFHLRKHGLSQSPTPAPTTSLYAPSPTHSRTSHLRLCSHARKPCVHYRSLLHVSPSLAPSPSPLLPLLSRARSACQAHPPSASSFSHPQRNNSSRDTRPGGVQGEHRLAVITETESGCCPILLVLLGVHTRMTRKCKG